MQKLKETIYKRYFVLFTAFFICRCFSQILKFLFFFSCRKVGPLNDLLRSQDYIRLKLVLPLAFR
jgi:hypothetical protein